MSDCIANTINGFNEQVNRIKQIEQKFPDQEIVMGLTYFNHEVTHHLTLLPTDRIPILTKQMYIPDGTTALLDAIGSSIKMLEPVVGKGYSSETTCVVVILTEGHENASKYYTTNAIKELIGQLEATGNWTFSFIGATLDAVDVAETMNIKRSNSFSFSKISMKEEVWNKLGDSMERYLNRKNSGDEKSNNFF
jgi:hypothetical protein